MSIPYSPIRLPLGGMTMKYMLLIYMAEDAMSEAEREACYGKSTRLAQELHSRGKYLSANPLHPIATATSVQDAAHRANVVLPDTDVTRVARAAAQLARGLVAGDHPGVDDALRVLGKGWHRLPCLAEFRAA